jgi:CheY-like chemotaxis protein
VIKGLQPSAAVPADGKARENFDVLHHRFVLKLTQNETAYRLHVSARTVRRLQRAATHTLARLLWEHSLAQQVASTSGGRATDSNSQTPNASAAALDWRSQVQQDLAALQAGTSAAVADVREAIDYAVDIEGALTARQGVNLRVDRVEPGLVAAVHPSVLRQILVMAVGQMAQWVPSGRIAVGAAMEDGRVQVNLAGPASSEGSQRAIEVLQAILGSLDGGMEAGTEGDYTFLRITLPSAGRVAVLVVDDNVDQVHFYRRCTVSTRYNIGHAPHGRRSVEAIAACCPDVIILDIILPDVDGWQLLAHLKKRPDTRSIPVIICSIVREARLASELGAAAYLPKPVERTALIQALDRALERD